MNDSSPLGLGHITTVVVTSKARFRRPWHEKLPDAVLVSQLLHPHTCSKLIRSMNSGTAAFCVALYLVLLHYVPDKTRSPCQLCGDPQYRKNQLWQL